MKKAKPCSIKEAAQQCGIAPELILRFISFEWISPADAVSQDLDEEDLARARLISELQHEFGVNDESVSIILNLLDQLHRTRLQLKMTQSRP
jgi:chaperone modulatory protein CbpM